MFDISFWELALIAVVALIVIGPEKLPAVARTLGYWFGKARRFVATVQEDINREVNKSEELKRLVEEQSKIKDIHEIIEHTVNDTKKTVSVGASLNQPKSSNSGPEAKSEADGDKPQIQSKEPSKTTAAQTPPAAEQVNEQTK